MFPGWETEYYKVRAEVKNKKGLEKEYVVNDSTTTVVWVPMMVVFPLTLNTKENVQRNMYRNIISQMYEDRIIGES
jgi:hypothetical protein